MTLLFCLYYFSFSFLFCFFFFLSCLRFKGHEYLDCSYDALQLGWSWLPRILEMPSLHFGLSYATEAQRRLTVGRPSQGHYVAPQHPSASPVLTLRKRETQLLEADQIRSFE